MTRQSCPEAQERLEIIRSELSYFKEVLSVYAETGDEKLLVTRWRDMLWDIPYYIRCLKIFLKREQGIREMPFHANVDYDAYYPKLEELKTMFDHVHERFFSNEVRIYHEDNFIEQNLPEGEVPFSLFEVDDPSNPELIVRKMAEKGLQPARYEEILAFAAAYPDEQKKFDIVALGSYTKVPSKSSLSTIINFRRPTLESHHGTMRNLGAQMCHELKPEKTRFLATKKVLE